MNIIDRYVLRLFFKVAIVCSVSMIGLFVVIDLFEHLEEFMEVAETEGGMASVALQYYTPRALTFFDRTSGLLALIAAIFVITLLARNRELEAILAGGIPLIRVVKPLFIGVLVIAVLAILNREFVIPQQKDRLTREVNNWHGNNEIGVRPRFDYESEIFIAGKSAIEKERRINAPIFQLPGHLHDFSAKIIAEDALFLPAETAETAESGPVRPSGYLLRGVSFPYDIDIIESASVDDRTVIYTPVNNKWLQPDECFVVSAINFQQLTEKESSKQFASTADLINGLRTPGLDFGSQTKVAVHSRLIQPFLDVALLFVGIPIVISRQDRNIFMAIGVAMGLLAGFFILSMASHSLGNYGLIRPALAAWIPLIVIAPFAWVLAQRMK